MAFPLKSNYKPRGPLCQISLDDLNTIFSMINGLSIQMIPGSQPAVLRSSRSLTLQIPTASGSTLPSNAGKSKWMVPTLSADNATATDNPDLWIVDWIHAHA